MSAEAFNCWTKYEGGYFVLNKNGIWNEYNKDGKLISSLHELDSYVICCFILCKNYNVK